MDPIRRQLKGLLQEPDERGLNVYAKACETLESDRLFFTVLLSRHTKDLSKPLNSGGH